MKILIPFCDNFECDREGIRPEMPTSKEKAVLKWMHPVLPLIAKRESNIEEISWQQSKDGRLIPIQ